MPKVLFSDNEFPDVRLERDLFAAAGIEFAVAQCKTEDEVIAAARDCAGILLQYAPITERVVAGLPRVGIVSRIGAGFDTVDTEACAKHGVWVANSPDYGVGEVATHALALALALMRNVVAYHRDIHAGRWHYLSSGELRRAGDMTLGIVGPRPHRQANGARRAQRVPARDRLRPLHHRRRFSGVRRAGEPHRRVRAERRRLAARAARRRRRAEWSTLECSAL